MLPGTLGASLFGNLLAGKGVIRAGEGTIRGGYGSSDIWGLLAQLGLG